MARALSRNLSSKQLLVSIKQAAVLPGSLNTSSGEFSSPPGAGQGRHAGRLTGCRAGQATILDGNTGVGSSSCLASF